MKLPVLPSGKSKEGAKARGLPAGTRPLDDEQGNAGGIYFVCRSPYEAPNGVRLVRFPNTTILSWVRSIWPREFFWRRPFRRFFSNLLSRRIDRFLGGRVYGFDEFLCKIVDQRWKVPETIGELRQLLGETWGTGDIVTSRHAIQAWTDDDEFTIAWYLFDDHFMDRYRERVEYFLHADHWLPDRFDPVATLSPGNKSAYFGQRLESPSVSNEGRLSAAILIAEDGLTFDAPGAFHFEGFRLTELGSVFPTSQPSGNQWPKVLLLLRAFLIRHNGNVLAALNGLKENG
jgi:hypothetical protein